MIVDIVGTRVVRDMIHMIIVVNSVVIRHVPVYDGRWALRPTLVLEVELLRRALLLGAMHLATLTGTHAERLGRARVELRRIVLRRQIWRLGVRLLHGCGLLSCQHC